MFFFDAYFFEIAALLKTSRNCLIPLSFNFHMIKTETVRRRDVKLSTRYSAVKPKRNLHFEGVNFAVWEIIFVDGSLCCVHLMTFVR